MASKFEQSLKMLQDLKQSHTSLEKTHTMKIKEAEEAKERYDSQTRQLKTDLNKKYQEDIQHFQQSYMQRFDQQLIASSSQKVSAQSTMKASQADTMRSLSHSSKHSSADGELPNLHQRPGTQMTSTH